jgi:F-type H+-transporting ATPase subunit b
MMQRGRRAAAIAAVTVVLGAGFAAARVPAEGHPGLPSGHAPAARGHEAAAESEASPAEHDESAPPEPMNWWHGLLGEKADEEPNLLWRAPGEPPPFLASLINFGVLVFLFVRFGKRPLAAVLVKRKETIMREIDEAQRLRRAAEQRLEEYEGRLSKIGVELERVRREFLEQGERDKERIVREAKDRRERMTKDAEILIVQESKQMQKEMLAEVVSEATRLATEILAKRMTLGDHDRFAEGFLSDLRSRSPRSGSLPAQGAAAKGRPS